MQDNYFSSVLSVQGKLRGFDMSLYDLRKIKYMSVCLSVCLTLGPLPREIFYCEGPGKEQGFDLQFALWGGAHSRALKAAS